MRPIVFKHISCLQLIMLYFIHTCMCLKTQDRSPKPQNVTHKSCLTPMKTFISVHEIWLSRALVILAWHPTTWAILWAWMNTFDLWKYKYVVKHLNVPVLDQYWFVKTLQIPNVNIFTNNLLWFLRVQVWCGAPLCMMTFQLSKYLNDL